MKRKLVLVALALASCNQQHRAPVGRFQMLPTNNGHAGVFVLDTVTGHIWVCEQAPNGQLAIKCGMSQQTAQPGDDGAAV